MGTYGNPIGLALRDVGQGIGNVLEQDARRKDQALQQQYQTGELSLRGALLANQATQQAAEQTVRLADVERQGRQFDTTTRLKEQEMAQQQEYQRGTLDVARGGLGVQQQQATETARHQQATERMMGPYYGAVSRTQGAQADLLDVHREQARRALDIGKQEMNLSAFVRNAQGQNPEAAALGQTFMTLMTPPGEAGIHRTDAQGDVWIPQDVAMSRLNAFKPFVDSIRKTTLTDEELLKDAATAYGHLDDATKATKPFQDFIVDYAALARNPTYVQQNLLTLETSQRAQLVANQEALFKTKNKRDPVPGSDDYKKVIDPAVNSAIERGRREITLEALGGSVPKTLTAPSPPEARGVPLPGTPTTAGLAALPRPTQQAIVASAAQEATRIGRPPAELFALMEVESGFDPRATHPTSQAAGLMQLIPTTAQRYNVTDPYSIPDNIRGGAEDWARAVRAAQGDLRTAYNTYYNPGASDKTTAQFLTAVQRYGGQQSGAGARLSAEPAPSVARMPSLGEVFSAPAWLQRWRQAPGTSGR